ncbi:MAG TPA: hypothetical protein VJB59_13230 [Bdellovibrionota bacterium]|nr:hypothetical protein [Bdellovibrionota bacterium]
MKHLIIVLAFIIAFPAFAQSKKLKPVQAPSDLLESVVGVRNLSDDANQLSLRIFETALGDPAMNGDQLLLVIAPANPARESFTWDTGINVRGIKRVKLNMADPKQPQIIIKTIEDVLIYPGEIVGKDYTYTITYSPSPQGGVEDTIEVSRTRD